MEAMALFIDKDNKLSFEEAKRQAAQKLATNERLKGTSNNTRFRRFLLS
jgi:hypothetical protein